MRGSIRPVIVKLAIFAVFTLAMTGILAAVIGNIQPFTRTYAISAVFSDATGLLQADIVKVAGVTIGKVTGAEVTPDGHALVRLQIKRAVRLPRTVHAAIRYRNLVGQRMVVLEREPGSPDNPSLRPGSRIPLARTSPALDLGVVFNNLQPALNSLDPGDVNIVSNAIVKVFSGRELQVQRMIAQLADLAQSLGDKGPVAAKLIVDLDTVVRSLAGHDRELQTVLSSFDQVLGALDAHSSELGRAVTDLGDASNGLADIVEGNRPALDDAIRQLSSVLALVAQHKQDLDGTLKALPATTHALNRATTYGEWANLVAACVQGVCGSGYAPSLRGGGLADLYRSAIGGAS